LHAVMLLALRAVVAIVGARSALEIAARATVAAPSPVQREAVTLVVVAVLIEPLIAGLRLLGRRLLAAGNERWQPIDVAATVRSARLAWALHNGLMLRLLLLWERLRVARQVGLRLARSKRHLADDRLLIAVVLVEHLLARTAGRVVLGAGGEMRIVLAKLLLRRRDQTVVVLRVLVVVLCRDRIARRLGIARELNVFFGNVGGVASNFNVGSVRFVNTRHRIVVFAVAMLVVTMTMTTMTVIAAAHALVLTVSHDSPVC
jgi:hypothetical protein